MSMELSTANEYASTDVIIRSDDESISTLTDTTDKPARFQEALAAIRRVGTVSAILRLAGAMAVATAMGIFLLDGVNVDSDLQRFMTMLGFSAALTAAGLAMSLILKEQRGSRVFIGLSLASVPVNFTVLGAMIYSVLPWDNAIGDYPAYASWKIGDLAQLSLTVPLGALVVTVVSWFGFSVLARSERAWLSMTLLGTNLLLLLPIRQNLTMSILSLACLVLIAMIYKRCGRESVALKTNEGKIAMAILAIAPIIMVVRSLFLYEISPYSMLIMTSGMYAATRYSLYRQKDNSAAETALALLGAFFAVGVAIPVYEVMKNFVLFPYAQCASFVALLAITWDISRKNTKALTGRCINTFAIMFVAFSVSIQSIFLLPSVTLLNVAVLLTVAIIATRHKLKLESILAGLGLVALIFINAGYFWSTVVNTGWWGIAVLGAVAIVSGSLLDRLGPVAQLKVKAATKETAMASIEKVEPVDKTTGLAA